MFIAHNNRGDVISLIGLDRHTARKLKMDGPYFCPACGEAVILKAGSVRVPHFAHMNRCPVKPEGETPRHLTGKRVLFQWFIRQGYRPQLEWYIPDIQQRPDLMIEHDGRSFAVEFQVSPISVKELLTRTKAYLARNIFPLWFVDRAHIRERGVLGLNDFLAFFIQTIPSGIPSLYSFDPEKRMFTVYTNIIPYTSQRAFYDRKVFSIHTDVKTLFTWHPLSLSFFDRWLPAVEQWLVNLTIAPAAHKHPFLHYLYKHQIHPLQLPPEVGLPVPGLYVMKTPPFIWQGYLWHYFFFMKGAGRSFTLAEVEQFLFGKLRRKIQKRIVAASWQNPERKSPVEHYLQILCELGLLTKKENRYFLVKEARLIQNPNRNRKALLNDFYRRYKGKILRTFLLTK